MPNLLDSSFKVLDAVLINHIIHQAIPELERMWWPVIMQKIADCNQKAFLISSGKKPYKPIEISETGLELIEFLSLDCINTEGV